MELYHETVTDSSGNIVNGASITVTVHSTGSPATIYDKNDGALSNPFLSGYDRSKGEIDFKAANGLYDIQIVSSDTTTIKSIALIDADNLAAEYVANVTALRALTPVNGSRIYLKAHTTEGDEGGGFFRGITGAPAATYTDDNGVTILPSGGDGSAAFLREYTGHINVKWYGATGDGSTDDLTAIASAIDLSESTSNRNVYFPAGTYIVSDTIGRVLTDTEYFGLTLIGDGSLTTIIKGSKTSGAVVALNRSNSSVQRIGIDATTARQAGTSGDQYGLLIEPPDSSGKAVASCIFDDVRVINQPDHGFVHIGNSQLSMYNKCLSQSNGGHGYVFDRGTLHSRTNTSNPGITTLDTCWAIGNGGHGVVCGNPSDTAGLGSFRMLFLNWESSDNASDATVRHAASCDWFRGENIVILNSAIGFSSTSTLGALTYMGRNLNVINTRIIQCANTARLKADVVSGDCIGVDLDVKVTSQVQSIAVIFDNVTVTQNVKFRNTIGGNVTAPFTSGAIGAYFEDAHGPQIITATKSSNQAVNNTTTLADCTDLALGLAANETVSFKSTLRYNGGSTSDIKIAVIGPSGTTVRWSNAGNTYISTGDAVTISNSEITESSSRSFGATSGTRYADIVGTATASSTAGDLKVQFAQNSAVAENTSILAGSTFTIIRGQ